MPEALKKLLPYGGKLCEGFEGAFFPEVGYVVQGSKVCILFGKDHAQGKALCESLTNDKITIVESIDEMEMVEREGKKIVKDGRWLVEGPYQRSDVKNANGRTYGRKIWERLVNNPKSPVMTAVKERAMIGHLEHPKDGRTDGKEGALVVTDLKLQEDGVVWGQSELLDTPNGLILQEYTRKNVRWGVSSRGAGTVGDDGRVNETDFMVETWDAVMRPSTPGAYPKRVGEKTTKTEGDEGTADAVQCEMTEESKACVEQARALSEEAHEGLSESEQTKFAQSLLTKLGEVDDYAKAGTLPPSVANDVRGWLYRKLSESLGTDEGQVEAQIEKALKAAPDKGMAKRNAAFSRVIESLQRRVEDSVTEATTAREKLTEAEKLLKERDDEIAALKKKLVESETANRKAQAKLETATETIASLSRKEVANPVADAVEEAIKEVPALEQHRAVLERAADREEFTSLLESLLPTVLVRQPMAPQKPLMKASAPSSRTTLPKGAVISEGITARGSDYGPATPGAKMAGAVLSHMGQNQAK